MVELIDDWRIFGGGLVAGLVIVSSFAYFAQGALPDIISVVSFTLFFTVIWIALNNLESVTEKLSLFE